ncbi:MAG: hypothetical protein U0930_12630 [Pirellulales bacterium]
MNDEQFLGLDSYSLVWLCSLTWCTCLALLFLFSRRNQSLGLSLAYALLLTVVHGGGFVYLVPGYDPSNCAPLFSQGASIDVTAIGLALSTLAILVYTIGTYFADYVVTPRILLTAIPSATPIRFGRALILVGVVFFLAIFPLSPYIPSGASITSSGVQLTVIGICIFAFAAVRSGTVNKFSAAAATLSIPAATILIMGFVGYGVVAVIEIACFFVRFFRMRITLIVGGMFIFWLALSFYVTYMKGRDEIREKVWSRATITERVSTMANRMLMFELFDPSNVEHLYLFDIRMNQNHLVGKSYNHIHHGSGQFYYGESLMIAAVAWVPRVIWPNKPSFGGSGQFASQFTGMYFASGTSVGVGFVMELYANFGIPGIVIGFFIMAVVIRYLDRAAAMSFRKNQLWEVTKFVLLGFSLMQPGGLLAECVASFAASYILMIFLRWLMSNQSMFTGSASLQAPAVGNVR